MTPTDSLTTREEAERALTAALRVADSPVAVGQALRDVAARCQFEHRGTLDALRLFAEQQIEPQFDGAAKAVVWALLEPSARLRGHARDAEPAAPLARPRSLSEILADPGALEGPKVVAPRFAYAERVSLLAGREKDGKSTLISAIAATVSREGDFLGEPCRGGSVLYLCLEEPLSDPARRLVAFGCDPDRLFLVQRVTEPLKEFRAHVESVEPTLVLIDSLAAFTEPLALDPGSASAWTPVMGELGRVARDSGAGVILIHHARKSDGHYRDSTAIGAGVDAVLEMASVAEDASVRRIRARARWHLPDVSIRLLGDPFDPDTRPQYEVASGKLSLDVRVLLFVEGHPGCSTRDVRDNVTGQGKAIRDALDSLKERGAIRSEEDGPALRWFACQEGGNHFGNRSAAEGGSRENPHGTATEPPSGTGPGGGMVPPGQHTGLAGGTTPAPRNRPRPDSDLHADLDRALGGGAA